MSSERRQSEHEALAAEQALRLLIGAEALSATRLEREDVGFAAQVARWRGRFAPLLAETGEKRPPEAIWSRIEEVTLQKRENVVVLRRAVARWQGMAAGMTAIAASLALLLLLQPRSSPPPVNPSAAAPMVAMLGDSGKQMKVVASWDPSARQLVLAVAGDMPADPNHSHELWVIPRGGGPQSLGTMPQSKQMHMRLAETISRLLRDGATIAISVEPPGGSPTGKPTGPVVASGALNEA